MTSEKKKTVKARLVKNVEEGTFQVKIKSFLIWKTLKKEVINDNTKLLANEIQVFKSKKKAIKEIYKVNNTKKELLNIELYPTIKTL